MEACGIEQVLPTPVLGRAYAGELDELVNEVGLVEVPALHGKLRPVDLWGVPRRCDRVLEPLHASEELRCQANFCGKHLDKSPLAQIHRSCDIPNLRLTVSPREHVQPHTNSTVETRRIGKPLQKSLLQESEPIRRFPQ